MFTGGTALRFHGTFCFGVQSPSDAETPPPLYFPGLDSDNSCQPQPRTLAQAESQTSPASKIFRHVEVYDIHQRLICSISQEVSQNDDDDLDRTIVASLPRTSL